MVDTRAVTGDRPFHLRSFASLLLLGSFPLLAWSGVVLYIAPRGRFANWNAWTVMGLRKDQWSAVHTNLSVLVMVVAVLHLVINWRVIVAYLKRCRSVASLPLRRELACALALVAALLVGTLANAVPFQSVIHARSRIRNAWEQPPLETGNSARAPIVTSAR